MLPIDTGVGASKIQDSYLDPNSLNSIKAMGRDRDPQALKEVSKKFEAMFVQQMLKSMREANDVFSEGNYFDSQTSRFHRDMLDQQMVLNLTSGRGVGLADHFYRQMMQNHGAGMKPETEAVDTAATSIGDIPARTHSKTPAQASEAVDALDTWVQDFMRMSDGVQLHTSVAPAEQHQTPAAPVNYALPPQLLTKPLAAVKASGQKASVSESQENFVMLLKPHAEKAAAELNINPDVLIAQVALETGWGKHVIHDRQGGNSFNLFNIKAGSQWQGEKVNVSTVEYRAGIAASEKSDFRKYSDYAQSFADYVGLIKNNPRYQQALEAGGNSAAYAEALQSAGYATDPEYAQKIKRLLNTDAIKSLDLAGALKNLQAGILPTGVQSVISLAANSSRQIVE